MSPVATLRRFRSDQDGSMTIFGLFLFCVMILIAAIALDFTRLEAERTRLQATLDRAVLAAADLEQPRDRKQVVLDYMSAAGLSGAVDAGDIVPTGSPALGWTTVAASADVQVSPFLLHWLGINTLTAAVASTATERVTNVEISLVLDVSGSMAGDKIANMRTAAQQFVTTVRRGDTANRVSISLVPYSSQVLVPASIRNRITWAQPSYAHAGSGTPTCALFTDADFLTTRLTTSGNPVMAVQYGLNSSMPQNLTTYASPGSVSRTTGNCQEIAGYQTQNSMAMPITSAADTNTSIANLVKSSYTSIYVGMKWGVALLDSSTVPLFDPAVTAYAGRPAPFAQANQQATTAKYIVLLTDGFHEVGTTRVLRAEAAYGVTGIYRNTTGSVRYSRYDPLHLPNSYWVPHFNNGAGAWRRTPFDGTLDEDSDGPGPDRDTDGTAPVIELSYEQLWQSATVNWVAWELYARSVPNRTLSSATVQYNVAMTRFIQTLSQSYMDDRLSDICTTAKEAGITIFTIAFEAPPAGVAAMSDCASATSTYFNANTTDINATFSAIASQITQLHLER